MKIKYIIISGYVAILFGRSRGTEDIDIFIEDIDRSLFYRFAENLQRRTLWIVNTSSKRLAYDMLHKGDAIRIAKKSTAIPNIEIKLAKTREEKQILENPLKAAINKFGVCISPIESQIAFKFWLGSEKDIEDAVYLYELFKDKLNKKLLKGKCKELNVLGRMKKYVK